MSWNFLRSCVVAAIVAAPLNSALAALVIADFNDLSGGAINTKAGGTGFAASNWSGSGNISVVGGSLTSTKYAITQPGTQRMVSGNNPAIRQAFRNLAAPQSGEIWFSFLTQTNSAPGRSGISFNAPTASPFTNLGTAYLNFAGNGTSVDLHYQFGNGSEQTISTVASAFGTPILVVGKMVLNPGGANDSITVWLDPDLMANPNINAYTPVINSSDFHFADSIDHIGLIAYRQGGVDGFYGHVDAFYMSNNPTSGENTGAFYEVTGLNPVPEPATLALASLGGIDLLMAAARKRRK